MCGGCLIAKNAVLTAAHCTLSTDPNDYNIRQGKTTQQEIDSFERLQAISVHPHKEYNKEMFRADITVILIDPSHSLTNYLTLGESTVSEGTPVHLAGWGKEVYSGEASQNLKTLDLKVMSDSVCKGLFAIFEPQTHLCASSPVPGHSACMGDSGSPLVSNDNTVVGVVSYGDQMCSKSGTSFTRVSAYAARIKKIVGNKESPGENQTQNTTSKSKEESQPDQYQPTNVQPGSQPNQPQSPTGRPGSQPNQPQLPNLQPGSQPNQPQFPIGRPGSQPGMPNYPPQQIQYPGAQPDQYKSQDFYMHNQHMQSQNQDEPTIIYYNQDSQVEAISQGTLIYSV
ncbi:Chymase [Entomophthora muscae]|uniref:Chymase n=1 Tax=Entomophthora muscae TaxID=34485 RepID=A0ACC2TH67_9FUNG|nr:Chymase [Entomophthora muscae]